VYLPEHPKAALREADVTLDEFVDRSLRDAVGRFDRLSGDHLRQILRLMAKWRAQGLAQTIAARQKGVVAGGPFAGLRIPDEGSEGSRAAQLLGHYEHELQPTIEAAIAARPSTIVNIGCAHGYYAVGLAQRLPEARVYAYDINEVAQRFCRRLAEGNGVGERVSVAGLFAAAEFERFRDVAPFVLVDIEGAELDLLDPDASPALKTMSVLVECHDCFKPGISATLYLRFAASHDITRIEPNPTMPALPDWLANSDQLDQLLAIWEWRQGKTPWLHMRPKPIG
jgi:SAM-dependent methyltransferase